MHHTCLQVTVSLQTLTHPTELVQDLCENNVHGNSYDTVVK